MTLYVGTSGWAYKEWKPDFYPADLPQARFLEHYGKVLSACEINATFYRRQSEETFDKWAAATPPDFRFATKAHRGISFTRQLAPDEDRRMFLKEWTESVMRLGPKLGVVFVQIAKHHQRDDEALAALLEALAEGPRFAIDFVDPSWDAPDVDRLVADAGGTVCLSEREGVAPERLPAGPVGYVRLRSQHYEQRERNRLKDLLRAEAAERDVFAFTKHEGTTPRDNSGGVGLSRWLAGQARG